MGRGRGCIEAKKKDKNTENGLLHKNLAEQTDKGIVLAASIIESLRRQNVLLPSVMVLERICAEAITRANRRIYAALTDPLSKTHQQGLEELLRRKDGGTITWLVWLRQSPGRPKIARTHL